MPSLLRYHWNIFLGLAAGIAAGLLAHALGRTGAEAVVIGWVAGALAYLVPMGRKLFFAPPEVCRRNAAREDDNREVLMALVLTAVAMSFVAVGVALREAGQGHKSAAPWLVGLAFVTLVLSWCVVQALFAVHYAHRYFGDADGDGDTDGGFQFTGDKPSSYRDFVYVAVCMGATCQVSDFNCTNVRMRNLVTVHACLAFLFNTVVLAFGINIVASGLGQ